MKSIILDDIILYYIKDRLGRWNLLFIVLCIGNIWSNYTVAFLKAFVWIFTIFCRHVNMVSTTAIFIATFVLEIHKYILHKVH